MARGRISKYDDPNYRPTPPLEPLRTLTESLLGAELHKLSTRVTIKFDERADASRVHRTLCALQDCYKAPR